MATLNFPTSAWDKEGEKRYKVGTQNGLVFVGNPVAIKEDNGTVLALMAIEYYERMTGKTVDIKEE